MDVKYVIADSGGSSTNWGIVLQNNEVILLNTASLHPKYALLNEDPLVGLIDEFRGMHVPLYFYGAGCSTESIQKAMELRLLQLGFSEVHVFPDTLAACRALYGNRSGWLAILGTGSILVHYDGLKITHRIGGYGSLIGDEGSGFYFGKLLIQFLLRSEKWHSEWIGLFQSKEYILSKLAGSDAQKWIATLAKLTSKMDFRFLHQQNATLFVETYCLNVSKLTQISFIGTYGYEQQNVFREVFQRNGIQVEKSIASPLKDLVSFHQFNEKIS